MAILPSDSSYQKISLISNITLYWPFYTPSGEKTMTDIMDIEPDQDGWSITLPDASLVGNGTNFLVNNISIHSFKLFKHDGITELATIAGGEVKFINLTDNTTNNGIWSVIPFGAGQSAITAITATSGNNSINITNGNIVPPGGVIDFTLPTSLTNFNNINSTSFPVIKTTAPLTFGTVELVAGENIVITNASGISGEPVINLNNTVSGLNSLEVGDITNMDFKDRSFDYILCFGLYHNLEKNLEKAVLETHRVLRNGGRVCASFRADNLQTKLVDYLTEKKTNSSLKSKKNIFIKLI